MNKCRGECLQSLGLQQFYQDLSKPGCKETCKLHPCLNYAICEMQYPETILNSNNGLCPICLMLFNAQLQPVEMGPDELCIICTEPNQLYKLPNCRHSACALCINKWYDLGFDRKNGTAPQIITEEDLWELDNEFVNNIFDTLNNHTCAINERFQYPEKCSLKCYICSASCFKSF